MTTAVSIIPDSAASIALTAKGQMVLRSVGEAAGFASLMVSGGMLPKGVSPAQAVVSIIAGASVGLNPFESVQSIAVINGRPSLYGDGMKAVVQGSGVWESEKVDWYKGADGNIVACQVTVKRKGNPEPIIGRFSEKMARKAGLWGKAGPWTQYPDRMMLARARAFAYRDGFADILKGVRSAEEEGDILLAGMDTATPSTQKASKRTRRASASEILQADAEQAALPPKTAQDAPTAEDGATPAPEAEDAPTATPEAQNGQADAPDAIDGDADWLN